MFVDQSQSQIQFASLVWYYSPSSRLIQLGWFSWFQTTHTELWRWTNHDRRSHWNWDMVACCVWWRCSFQIQGGLTDHLVSLHLKTHRSSGSGPVGSAALRFLKGPRFLHQNCTIAGWRSLFFLERWSVWLQIAEQSLWVRGGPRRKYSLSQTLRWSSLEQWPSWSRTWSMLAIQDPIRMLRCLILDWISYVDFRRWSQTDRCSNMHSFPILLCQQEQSFQVSYPWLWHLGLLQYSNRNSVWQTMEATDPPSWAAQPPVLSE